MKIVLGSDGSIELTRGEHITRGQDKSRQVSVEWAEGVSPIDTGQFLADNMVVEMCITRPDGEQSGWLTAVKVDGEIKYLYILQAWDTAVSGQASLQVRWYDITQEESSRIIEVSNEAFFIVDNGKIAQPLNLSSENYNEIVLQFITPLSAQAFRKYNINALPDTVSYEPDGAKTAPALFYNFTHEVVDIVPSVLNQGAPYVSVKNTCDGFLLVDRKGSVQTEVFFTNNGKIYIRVFSGSPASEFKDIFEQWQIKSIEQQISINGLLSLIVEKINYSDIVDNLESSDNRKLLSAKQGAVLDKKISDVKKTINEIIITVDKEISKESENPVQNKVVAEALEGKVDKTDLDNHYNKTQVNDALNKKLNNSGDGIFDGNLSITGDLNIAGSTHTINQETLTIKDNFIAINGEGTTLETAGSAGVIVMSGKEQTVMANGIYVLDIEALCELIEVDTEAYDEAPWSEPFGAYRIIFKNDIFADLNYLYVSCIANDTSGYLGLSGGGYGEPMLQITPGLYDFAAFDSEGTVIINPSNLTWEYEINNQFVLPKHIEILCKIFKHEDGTPVTSDDFSIQNQAYAAPIYDVNDDSLKIGLGTYKKDEKGNIISFVFGAGQGQSITTRADNIQDGHLVKWDATKNKLVDAGTGLTEEEKNKFVKNTDYATSTKGGIAKLISAFGIGINENGVAYLTACDYGILNSQADGFRAVTPRYFAYGVKQALINPEISLNPANWTDEDRAKARQTLGISGSGGGGAKVYKHSIVIMGDYASSGYPTVIEVLSYSSSLASSYLNYIRLPKLCCIGGCAYDNYFYGDLYFSDVFGNKASGVLGYYDWENGDGTEFKEEYTEYNFSIHESDTWTDTVTEYKGG